MLNFLSGQPGWDKNFPKPEIITHGDFVDITNVPIFAANSKKRDPLTGEVVIITDEDLDKAIQNQKAVEVDTGFLMPFKEDHEETGPKIGLVDNFKRLGSWVFGTLKNITKKYYEEEIKTGHRGYCSAEYWPYIHKFSSVALLGAAPPEIKMPPLEMLLNFSETPKRGLFCFSEEASEKIKVLSYVPLLMFAAPSGNADGAKIKQFVRKEAVKMPNGEDDKKKDEGLDFKALFADLMNEMDDEKKKAFMEKNGLKFADDPANDEDKEKETPAEFASNDGEKQDYIEGYMKAGKFHPIRDSGGKKGEGAPYNKQMEKSIASGKKVGFSEAGKPFAFAEAYPEVALKFAEMQDENTALKKNNDAFIKRFFEQDEKGRDKDFHIKAKELSLTFAVDVPALCELAKKKTDVERELLLKFTEQTARKIPFDEINKDKIPPRPGGSDYLAEIKPLVQKYSEDNSLSWDKSYDAMQEKGLLPPRT